MTIYICGIYLVDMTVCFPSLHQHTASDSQLNIGMKPRSWYIACPVYSRASTECQVAVFGGNVHVVETLGDRIDIADLKILAFGKV